MRKEDGHLLLERRSLLVIQNEAYTSYLHGIKEINEDLITDDIYNLHTCDHKLGDILKRQTRISLTIRNVPKVLKSKIIFGRKR